MVKIGFRDEPESRFTDGTKIRVNIAGAVSSVNSKNTVSCKVYYKLSNASTWTQSTTVTTSNYAVGQTNLLLSQTFNALNSYDLKVSLTDSFTTIEQVVSVGTKQVMLDFYRDGSGIVRITRTPGSDAFVPMLAMKSPEGSWELIGLMGGFCYPKYWYVLLFDAS